MASKLKSPTVKSKRTVKSKPILSRTTTPTSVNGPSEMDIERDVWVQLPPKREFTMRMKLQFSGRGKPDPLPAELEEMDARFKPPPMKEEIRRGNVTAYHMLAACDIEGFEQEIQVVGFRTVFSVPFNFLTEMARRSGKRLRLLSPYREHLSQAFARFFMRVGLPADIPPFR